MPLEKSQNSIDKDVVDNTLKQFTDPGAIQQAGKQTLALVQSLTLGADAELAAVLYPALYEKKITLETLTTELPPETVTLLNTLSQLGHLDTLYPDDLEQTGNPDKQSESIRKMMLAMVRDPRVVVIMLAYKLYLLRQAKTFSRAQQVILADQVNHIYAPLANRLGIWQYKWELEDLAFRYKNPDMYHKIAGLLQEKRSSRESYINSVIEQLLTALKETGIEADISGRAKHIYSIWKKMRQKSLSFETVFDIRAVRILVADVSQCYAALGVAHTLWLPIPGQFDDYISRPKNNLYQSLHTAVIGPDGKTLEIQIRTHNMHDHAELGVAAHWRYKEQSSSDEGLNQRIVWMRKLLEPGENESDFLEAFKAELLEDRIYVLTPQGRVIDLPAGSTPLDFAYAVHTDVGHHCRGAKVNDHISKLYQPLKMGDRVEILTSQRAQPSRDWLLSRQNYLTTSRARNRVKQWFKNQDYDKNVLSGRSHLERELARLGLDDQPFDQLAQAFQYSKTDDFLAAIGSGDITLAQISSKLGKPRNQPNRPPEARKIRPSRIEANQGITVQGVGNLMTTISQCCKPVPPEPILGYLTLSRGISIHRIDCGSALRMIEQRPERVVEVNWGRDELSSYPVDLFVKALDRTGLLSDISSVISREKINLVGAQTRSDKKSGLAEMHLTVEITDLPQLSRLLENISRLPNVIETQRRHN